MATVKQVKAALKSIQHVLGGYETALECMDDGRELPHKYITVLRKYYTRELNRLEAGLPPVTEENHKKTRV